MLRRAENVHLTHEPGFFSGKAPVSLVVGRASYIVTGKLSGPEFGQWLAQSNITPVNFGKVGERSYWLFLGKWHWENDGLSQQQVHALLVTKTQRNEARMDRAQSIVAMGQRPQSPIRGAIPEDVKRYIWSRDRGSCRLCSSNVELQFDHIIPVSFGGSSTAENLQVLCGPCNRRKGASI